MIFLTLSDIESVSNKSECCELCENNYTKTSQIITKDKSIINVCELCKSIIVYDKGSSYKTILLYSKMSQKDIVNETIKKFKQSGCVPSPNDIDPNVKSINMSSQYVKYLMSTNEKIKNKLVNIKIFFTPEFDLDKIVIRNMFSKKSTQNTTFWSDIKKLQTFNVFKKIKIKLEKSKTEIDDLEKSRVDFTNKLKNTKGLLRAINLTH